MNINENTTAKQLLESLLLEREEHKKALAELDPLILGLQKRIAIISPIPNGASASESVGPQVPAIDLSGKSRREAAPVILKNVNRYLPTKELAECMEKSGLDMSSKNAVLSLYPVLEKHPELQKGHDEAGVIVWGLKEWPPSTQQNGNSSHASTGRGKSRRTVGNGGEQILRKAGKMHADDLLIALKEIGVKTTKKNLVDGLQRDKRKRFKNLGRNIWALNEATHTS